MQTIGHIIIRDEKILILIREKRYSRQLKIRRSGQDGRWTQLIANIASLQQVPGTQPGTFFTKQV